MKKSYKLLIGLAIIGVLAATYRAPVVDARINEVRKLIKDLAAGNVPIASTSTLLTSGTVLIGDSSNVAAEQTLTGDVTVSVAGVTFISTSSIVNADISASAAIAHSKFANLTSGGLLVGSSAGVATERVVTGDVTVSNTGVTTIGAGTVETAMLESGLSPSHVVLYAGFATWSGFGKTTYVPILGSLTTDVFLVTPKTAQTTELLVDAYIFSNNTAVFQLYTGEVNSKSWQYTIHRAAP